MEHTAAATMWRRCSFAPRPERCEFRRTCAATSASLTAAGKAPTQRRKHAAAAADLGGDADTGKHTTGMKHATNCSSLKRLNARTQLAALPYIARFFSVT